MYFFYISYQTVTQIVREEAGMLCCISFRSPRITHAHGILFPILLSLAVLAVYMHVYSRVYPSPNEKGKKNRVELTLFKTTLKGDGEAAALKRERREGRKTQINKYIRCTTKKNMRIDDSTENQIRKSVNTS